MGGPGSGPRPGGGFKPGSLADPKNRAAFLATQEHNKSAAETYAKNGPGPNRAERRASLQAASSGGGRGPSDATSHTNGPAGHQTTANASTNLQDHVSKVTGGRNLALHPPSQTEITAARVSHMKAVFNKGK